MPLHTSLHYLLLEVSVVLMTLLGAKWGFWLRTAGWLESRLTVAARHPWRCFFGLLLLGIAVRVALLPVELVPHPALHDEFSYLLASDTFVHGRLTNPTPPVAQAFETFHENMWPTYQSMYLPGIGLMLALGQLFGQPWIMVMLSTAIFCALLYWAVAAWLPRNYALAAALLAFLVVFNWNRWFDNYYSLALDAIAGALVLGSMPRILERRTIASVLPLSLGLAIFVFTRPYEGCIVSLPVVLMLLWHLRRTGVATIAKLAAPVALILAATFAWLFYYNWRGTGHPLLFAYVVNFQQYHISGPFLFSKLHPVPHYRHEAMRRFYTGWELTQHEAITRAPFWFLRKKVKVFYEVFVIGNGLLLLLGFASLLRTRKHPRFTLALVFLAFIVQILIMAWEPFPQYGAPGAALFFLLIAFGLLRLRQMEVFGISGRDLVRGWMLAQLLMTGSIFYRHFKRRDVPMEPVYAQVERPAMEKMLMSRPRKQLCLVRYGADHHGEQEWVFNRADMQDAHIVWARSESPEIDRQVIAAFPDRDIWIVQPESTGQKIVAYAAQGGQSNAQHGSGME